MFPSWLSLSVAKDNQEHVTHAVGIFTDITEIREADKLRYNATHDALTDWPIAMCWTTDSSTPSCTRSV